MFRWKDIWLSGGVNAFCAGLTGAWGLTYLFKGNTTFGIFELVICAINVAGFVACIMRIRLEAEVSLSEALPHPIPVPEPVIGKEEPVQVQEQHQGRLLRVEGEK